jgi:uncharacterized membrane protein (DUF485 family)
MTKLLDVAKNIKARVFREVSHAPVSFLAAIVTLIDVASRLAAGPENHLPPPVAAPSSASQSLSFPQPLALLEFLGFQVVIAFIADWLNERAIGFGASAGVIVGLFTAVLAAYLTAANANQLAYLLIANERSSPGAFDGAIFTGGGIVVGLMVVFLVERYHSRTGALDLAILLMYRIGPFVFVGLSAIAYFGSLFETRLGTFYNSLLNH